MNKRKSTEILLSNLAGIGATQEQVIKARKLAARRIGV